MIRKTLFPGFFLCYFFFVQMIPGVSGQSSTTAYHMYGIPQANHLNPAFQPSCNWHLGMPVLSPLGIRAGFSSLRYKDIFTYDSDLDAFITFMHPAASKDDFLDALKTHNTLSLAMNFDLLSFGFKKEQMYFSFDITDRLDNNFIIPGDFFQFIIYGSKNQDRFSFADMGEYFRYYRELAFGMSYNLDDRFQVGGRAKILFGVANITAKATELDLKTSIDQWDIKSKMDIRMSFPGLVTHEQPDGKVDSVDFDDDIPTSEIIRTVTGSGNPGFGIDVGFTYRPVEQLLVSGSLNDLGFIRWKSNVTSLSQDGQFTFDGIEIDLFGEEEEDDEGTVDKMLDSLTSQADFYVNNDPFTTALTGGFHLGAAYELGEKVRFGVVNRTRIYKYKFYNQFTLSANVQPIKVFSATLSYSVIGSNFANLGLGLSLYAGPLNLYVITDQLPSAGLIPGSLQSLNLRLGMNLVFGCFKKDKIPDDQPLID